MKRPTVPARRVLGIDPGTRLLGWAVVEGCGRSLTCRGHGVLRASARIALPERLVLLAKGLREVIAAHAPKEASVEEAFHGRDARAALRLGEGRGAIMLVLAEAGLPITGYANNVVKRAVTGSGRASKERVLALVRRLLQLEEEPATLDASDALALALCHLQRPQPDGACGVASDGGLPPRLADAIREAKRRDRTRTRRRAR